MIVNASCVNKHQDQINKQIETISPGLGEYMAMIEYHHTNLSKAIVNKNYQRANYEIDELFEVFGIAEKVHNNHEKLKQPLNKVLPSYAYEPLNLLRKHLKQNDTLAIEKQFKNVTISCNACHSVNEMSFIVIEN